MNQPTYKININTYTKMGLFEIDALIGDNWKARAYTINTAKYEPRYDFFIVQTEIFYFGNTVEA